MIPQHIDFSIDFLEQTLTDFESIWQELDTTEMEDREIIAALNWLGEVIIAKRGQMP